MWIFLESLKENLLHTSLLMSDGYCQLLAFVGLQWHQSNLCFHHGIPPVSKFPSSFKYARHKLVPILTQNDLILT